MYLIYKRLAAIIIFLILMYALLLEPLDISKGKKRNNWMIFKIWNIFFITYFFLFHCKYTKKQIKLKKNLTGKTPFYNLLTSKKQKSHNLTYLQ